MYNEENLPGYLSLQNILGILQGVFYHTYA